MNWIWNLCLANMRQQKIRMGLTILGVVIGVVSIVALLSIGMGVETTILSEFQGKESVTKITVYGTTEGKKKSQMLTDGMMEKFGAIQHVKAVYPGLRAGGKITYNHYVSYGELIGVPREYLATQELLYGNLPQEKSVHPEILMGRGGMYLFMQDTTGIPYMDSLSKEEKKKLDLTGETVKLSFGYTDDAQTTKVMISGMLDDNEYDSYCDLDVLKRYLKKISLDGTIEGQPLDEQGEPYNEWIYDRAIVIVEDSSQVETVMKKIQDMGFQTGNNKEYLDMVKKVTKMIQFLLGGIGLIALLVAVIGIGNTMTTSVYERIREIGVLKVLGCDTQELMVLFLLESGVLGGIGGLIGVLVSLGIVFGGINPLAVKLLSLEKGTQLALVPPWLMLLAIGGSVLLGLLAGYFPAKWAAGLKPVDSLSA